MTLSIFSGACWPSTFPLWKSVYSVLLPIFNLVVCSFLNVVIGSLYVLYMCSICKYLLLFGRLSFHFVDGFLYGEKAFKLIRSCLFIFAFIFFVLGDRSKKILLLFLSKIILSMFYSRRFMVSGLRFRSLIHFQFFFFGIWY